MGLLAKTAAVLACCAVIAWGESWHFDGMKAGEPPRGWRVAATNAASAPVWRVVSMKDAPSAPNALVMAAPPKGAKGIFGYGSVFNLCYLPRADFTDGTLSVAFKALKGREDRGGGIAWRIKGPDTYQVVRFNPLEDNLRLYYVHKGRRVMVANADARLAPGWHRMEVKVAGERIRVWLDGRLLIDAEDSHVRGRGGVGLWTKADAVTAFDDFAMEKGR
jgi:hypothetical protein